MKQPQKPTQKQSRQRIKTRHLSFASSSLPGDTADGHMLAASLDYPVSPGPESSGPVSSEPLAYAIMCHCFTCTRQTITTARVARGLAEAGYAVLRFDFSGLGESEGEFQDSHFRSMLLDIQAAAQFLQQHYQAPGLLLGHSLGGTACLAASQLDHSAFGDIKRIVTLASPATPDHVLHHFGPAMQLLEQGQPSEITVAGNTYGVKA